MTTSEKPKANFVAEICTCQNVAEKIGDYLDPRQNHDRTLARIFEIAKVRCCLHASENRILIFAGDTPSTEIWREVMVAILRAARRYSLKVELAPERISDLLTLLESSANHHR